MLEGQEDQMVLMYLCRKKRFITHFVLDQLGLEKWLQNIMIKVIMYKHNRKFIFKGYSTKIITIVVFHRLINKSILLQIEKAYYFQTLQLTDGPIKAYALVKIEKLMRRDGKSMKYFPDIEMLSLDMLEEIGNRLMNEEVRYDSEKQKNEYQRIYNDLNNNQKIAFDAIIKSVDNNEGRQIFVEGHGGTRKIYLWKAITTKIRSEGKIVLAVTSCGIAALLLEGGRTAHSRFHIPLTNTDESTCEIKQGSDLARLIQRTSLILWDESPMAHRNCFEALVKTLRDIFWFTNEDSDNRPFGGMTVVLGGDFRQILTVVPKGRREHIVNASIKRSYLWKHFQIFKLTQNMCLSYLVKNENEQRKMKEFAEWILNIGDRNTTTDDGDEFIKIPDDLLL
jgi:hypothetical protein